MSRNASNNENDESGEFGENGEFGESDGFDEILPHVKIRPNDLKAWVH